MNPSADAGEENKWILSQVLEKKGEIEKAFAMDERLSGRLDDSGEGTLERPPRRNPVPPPRIDSYINKGHSSLNSREANLGRKYIYFATFSLSFILFCYFRNFFFFFLQNAFEF